MTFGKCLKSLLATLNIRMSQLAKAINIDSSLVNRWVHEKRIPSVVYIDSIAEHLSKFLIDPIQKKLIDELLHSLHLNESIVEISDKEKLCKILHYSLNISFERKSDAAKNLHNNNIEKSGNPAPIFSNAIDLSSEDKLIYGTSNIFAACISLFESALKDKQKNKNIIYLTYHNKLDEAFFCEEKLEYLKDLLINAAKNNWNIIFLIRLDNGINNTLRFIRFLLPLIKTGKVSLYYLTAYESLSPRKEFYIVSGIGALSCFPIDIYSGTKCAFYFKNTSAINVLSEHADLLMKHNADNVIQYYGKNMKNSFFSALTEVSERPGNQFSYNIFNKLLIPNKLYIKLINQTSLSEEEKRISIFYYKKHFQGFLKNLHHYKFMDIFSSLTLDRLCQDRRLYLYTYSGITVISVETEDIIECLEYVIHVINKYPNYCIAVIYNNNIDDFVKNSTLFIKERTVVFLDIHEPDDRSSNIRLSINEPVIVKGFTEYYNSLWHKISSFNKDREDIVLLLKSYIDYLRSDD